MMSLLLPTMFLRCRTSLKIKRIITRCSRFREQCCDENAWRNTHHPTRYGAVVTSLHFFSSTSKALPTVNVTEHDCRKSSPEQITELVRPHFTSQTPVLLRQAVHHIPAIQRWTSWEYLEERAGSDTSCVAELGGNYATTAADETRCFIPFGDFIMYLRFFEERFGRCPNHAALDDDDASSTSLSPSSQELVYMAQNDLPQGLEDDVEIPSFCTQLGLGHLYSTMIWIGPYGCISPFHFDPLDNCFLQVVGRKRMWLYPPHVGPFLHAGGGGGTSIQDGRGGGTSGRHHHHHQKVQGIASTTTTTTTLQANTSPVDPRLVDTQLYPLVSQLPPAMEALLTPGDVLYMPSKWWHFVVTEETSISVNQWWR